jgi:hypothetical protein
MYIETLDRKRTMTKRLSDFKIENRKPRSAMAGQLLSIPVDDNEATKRVVMHSAKRVIQQHKKEIQELAYK